MRDNEVKKNDTEESIIMDDFFAPLRDLSAMIDEEKNKNDEKHPS